MKPELSSRLGKLKLPVLLRMREYKGSYELVNWWGRFLSSIPQNAGFEDLNKEQQCQILKWEEDLHGIET